MSENRFRRTLNYTIREGTSRNFESSLPISRRHSGSGTRTGQYRGSLKPTDRWEVPVYKTQRKVTYTTTTLVSDVCRSPVVPRGSSVVGVLHSRNYRLEDGVDVRTDLYIETQVNLESRIHSHRTVSPLVLTIQEKNKLRTLLFQQNNKIVF